MTSTRIQEIREREQKATKGPWLADANADDDQGVVYVPHKSVKDAATVIVEADWATEGDIDFIAHSRTDIPDLLDEVERLRNELDEWKRVSGVQNTQDLDKLMDKRLGEICNERSFRDALEGKG